MTQGQSIDWVTSQVEPGIMYQTDWFSIEYSRTMRAFQQNDQLVFGDYNAASSSYGFQAVGYSNWASENYTEIDRIKSWTQVAPDTDMYVMGWLGNTHNEVPRIGSKVLWRGCPCHQSVLGRTDLHGVRQDPRPEQFGRHHVAESAIPR